MPHIIFTTPSINSSVWGKNKEVSTPELFLPRQAGDSSLPCCRTWRYNERKSIKFFSTHSRGLRLIRIGEYKPARRRLSSGGFEFLEGYMLAIGANCGKSQCLSGMTCSLLR